MRNEVISIDVRVDAAAMTRRLRNVSDKIADKAMIRAMNDTVKHLRTEVKRPIAAAMGAKVGAVAKRIKARFASTQTLRASISGTGKPWNVMEFSGTRQAAKGVSHQAWGRRQVALGTFLATMPSGYRGAFKRSGKRRIKPIFGPGVPKVMAEATMMKAIKTMAREWFLKRLKHHVQFLERG